MFHGVSNWPLIMVKYSGNIAGCDVIFSCEVFKFMNDVAFIPILSIFLHDTT